MKPFLTSGLKIKFLGITPLLQDQSGVLNPQEIVALSALLTFKGKSIKKLFEDLSKKEGNIKDKIDSILQKSSLRGHASIATTPSLCLTYEGSKFLDSVLTGIYFSSSLVSSGRRTDTTEKDVIFPKKIFANKAARKIYKETSEEIIRFLNYLLKEGLKKDEASKILQYGIYGTGIIQLPIESIIGVRREYEREKEWMPEEVGMMLQKIEKAAKSLGIDRLYATRAAAPRNVFPYPNIFKDPKETNLTRELRKKFTLGKGPQFISMDNLMSPSLKEALTGLEKETKRTFSSLPAIKRNWTKLLSLRQGILRDYNLALRFKMLSAIPWRVWGERKRHRTCYQIIESIYYAVERAEKVFIKHEKQIRGGAIDKKTVSKIDEVFSIPPSVMQNKQLLEKYLSVGLNAFKTYRKLINLGIKPRDAIFVMPRAVKNDILQEFDLYNFLTGYYPLRLCQTAEEEMRRITMREFSQINKAFSQKGLNWLAKMVVPKCHLIGFCPEEKNCPIIKGAVKNYNEKFHKEMKEELKRRFENNLKNLGR